MEVGKKVWNWKLFVVFPYFSVKNERAGLYSVGLDEWHTDRSHVILSCILFIFIIYFWRKVKHIDLEKKIEKWLLVAEISRGCPRSDRLLRKPVFRG